MMRTSRRLVAAAIALTFIAALSATTHPFAFARVQAEDTNHDGRPDVWRFYEARGELKRVTIDSNFDGVPDREEVYERGALVRRESDRNFDQRIDLVEEFDARTFQHVRTIADVDYDGSADLLVLFQDGRPVHTEWAAPAHGERPAPLPAADSHLAPLTDPFGDTAAVRASDPVSSGAADFAVPTTVAIVWVPNALDEPGAPQRVHTGAADRPADSSRASICLRGPPAPLA